MEESRIEAGLVALLIGLTRKGRATWIRRPSPNDELLFCFVNNEEIVFEASFEDESPDRDQGRKTIHAFGGDYRNTEMLWLPGAAGLNELIAMFWNTPVSHEQYLTHKKLARVHLLDDLARVLADADD